MAKVRNEPSIHHECGQFMELPYQLSIRQEKMAPDLAAAAQEGHASLARRLLKRGAHVDGATWRAENPVGKCPLYLACFQGHEETVAVLLKGGADPNGPGGQAALFWAAFNGQLNVVKLLLGAGADPTLTNKDGSTPLIWAASRGHKQIVKVLLEAGVDVDKHFDTKAGHTALYWAKKHKHRDVAKVLRKAGAKEKVADACAVS